jgi:phospholipid/cholesterol/gamma-HCH transport system permease protein
VTLNDKSDLSIEAGDQTGTAVLRGPFTIHTVTSVQDWCRGLDPARALTIDLRSVTGFDTAGAWLIATLRQRAEAAGGSIRLIGTTPEMEHLLKSVTDALPEGASSGRPRVTLADRVELLGRSVAAAAGALAGLAGFLGLFLARFVRSIFHPREFRLTSLVHQCEEVGVKAVPIVALMSFLIGIVLAFQGSAQLRQFGAEVFVVDLISISILRELGILLTAIIVAGRTASAFTAAIGSMKMREEIDAMRTIGLDPALVLFVPRILALILMLPILGLIANVSGLLGGALMCWIELGISPAMFRTRLIEGGNAVHMMVGLVKAPVFAVIIGVVGCRAGMLVQSNAESLGRQTSRSVVAAIFAVIVADALFSIFFAEMGV